MKKSVQALKATGQKNKKKKDKNLKNILDLIHEVNELDEEFQNFAILIPGREQMIEENFPLHVIDYKRPTLQWCRKNVNTIRYGIREAGEKGCEWVNAWSNLYTKEIVPPGREAFDDSPEEDQERFLTLMLEDINNSRAKIYYKKWKFVLMKEEERDRSRFEGNDQNRSGGGEEEEGGTSADNEKRDEKVEKERDGAEEREEEVEKDVREDFKDVVLVDEVDATTPLDVVPVDVDVVPVDEVDAPPVINKRLLELRKTMGFSLIFPNFRDNDGIRCYSSTFTLQNWFDDHDSVESRWRPTILNNSKLDVVWNGDRLKRECLSLMQSLVLAVLDFHHDTGRPHGGLHDRRKIKLFQCIQSVGGNQIVRFRIELPKPVETEDSELLKDFGNDMQELKLILKEILSGKPLHHEMDYLFTKLLDCYPFSYKPWRTQLLRNFIGFWDGKSRAKFLVLLYYTMICDMTEKQRKKIKNDIDGSLCISCVPKERRPLFKAYKWIHRIPEGTFFHDVLTYDISAQVTEPKAEKDTKPQYYEKAGAEMIKYARVCLHHNRESGGSCSLDIIEIEVYMSNLFEGLILAAYRAMCKYNLFLC